MSGERNQGGFLIDDCRALYDLRTEILREVSLLSGRDERTTMRRLRVLAFWIVSLGESAFQIDPEADGMAIADDFWRRRAAGERGDDA